MYCPKCHKLNNCGCNSCTESRKSRGESLLIETYTIKDDKYVCQYCHESFCEGESVDFEWSLIVDGYIKDIPPDLCIKWFESNAKNRIDIQKEINCDEFGFILVFGEYFKKHPNDVSKEDWISIKRNFTIKDILKK